MNENDENGIVKAFELVKDITHWDYRVVRCVRDDYVTYRIHEVHFAGDQPKLMAESSLEAESVEELSEDLRDMLKAFEKPVLDENDVK